MDDDFDLSNSMERIKRADHRRSTTTTSTTHRSSITGGAAPKRLGDMLPAASGVKTIGALEPLSSRLIA
jgi:hypothetical protein